MKAADFRKVARVLLTGSSFVFFWSGGAMLSFLVLPLVDLRYPKEEEKRLRSQRWVQWGFGVFHEYMRSLRLTDYDFRKVELELPEGPFVMISNHPTLVDVTAIMAVEGRLSCVVRESYWRTGIHRLLEMCGHISAGDEDSALGSAAVAVQALERLKNGQPVLIFPEGTRSPEKGMWPFQRGAFEVARRAGVPLVPVFITADPPWLMKHQRWFNVPSRMNRMRLCVLEGITEDHRSKPEALTRNSKALAKKYQQLYQDHLDAWLQEREGSGIVRH